MKIEAHHLFLNGAKWPLEKVFFRPKSNPLDKFDRISLMGNEKEDYELYFRFRVDSCPKASSGYLLVETDTGKEPFHIPVEFP